MIAVDSSVICDYLLLSETDQKLGEFLAAQTELLAPTLIEYEVGHVLRRLVLVGKLSTERGKLALESFQSLRIQLHAAGPLFDRAWELRHNASFYDATYIALAEMTGAVLYTRDKRLAASQNHLATIRIA